MLTKGDKMEETLKIECNWSYQNKDFTHGVDVDFDASTVGLNLHSRYPNPVLVTKYKDKRLKVWLISSTRDKATIIVNGAELEFTRKNNNAAALYEHNLTDIEFEYVMRGPGSKLVKKQALKALNVNNDERIKKQRAADAVAKENRIAANDAKFARDFANMESSPVEYARERCHHLLEKEGRSREFWFYRGMINQIYYWRNKVKPGLEKQVSKEMDAADEWLVRWVDFRDWWQSIPIDPKKYNDQFIEKHFLRKFNEDIQYMTDQYTEVMVHGYRGEIELAASEVGLEVWEGSEEWDDGIIWFIYPETEVLFPFNLCWVHVPSQGFKWSINTNFRINQWMLNQHGPMEDIDQDTAWNFASNFIGQGKTYCSTDFKLTNRLLNYHGGYKGPNVFFNMCKGTVKAYADTNPPPEPIRYE